MKRKVLKNEDGKRKDWEGRSPRQRANFTNAQLNILKEWAETYFAKYPEKRTDPDYDGLYERICQHIINMTKPLTETVYDFPAFDEKWNFEK